MDSVVLFDDDKCSAAKGLSTLRPKVVKDAAQLEAAFTDHPDALWISMHGRSLLRMLADCLPGRRSGARLLLLDREGDGGFFRTLFDHVVVARGAFLPTDELAEVLADPNAADLFIGGRVDLDAGVVLLVRGNLDELVVPLRIFTPTPTGTRPDPRAFAVTDHGQTIAFGAYEAAADAILFEADPGYRRRIRAKRRHDERTFGASLRRLRIQRGLRQSDFPGLSEKEIGRIERGEVAQPRGETLQKLARRLKVRADEISEY